MAKFAFSVIGVLVLGTMASSQGPPPTAQDNLDLVLRAWEKAMTDLKSFQVIVDRTTLDKSFKTEDKFKGYALFVKAPAKDAGSRARIEMAKTTNPKIYEKYICTGTYLYEYSPAASVVRVHNMPRGNGTGEQQESFLSFLFGMGADQAKARYDMTYVSSDQHYHYVRILPKLAQDKGDFAEARLSLLRSNNLPAQMWYLQANKTEITWSFTEPQVNVNIDLKHFDPVVPPGWKMERVQPPVPANVTPTVRTKPQ